MEKLILSNKFLIIDNEFYELRRNPSDDRQCHKCAFNGSCFRIRRGDSRVPMCHKYAYNFITNNIDTQLLRNLIGWTGVHKVYLDNDIKQIDITNNSKFVLIGKIPEFNYIGYFSKEFIPSSLFEKSLINKYIKQWMQK